MFAFGAEHALYKTTNRYVYMRIIILCITRFHFHRTLYKSKSVIYVRDFFIVHVTNTVYYYLKLKKTIFFFFFLIVSHQYSRAEPAQQVTIKKQYEEFRFQNIFVHFALFLNTFVPLRFLTETRINYHFR